MPEQVSEIVRIHAVRLKIDLWRVALVRGAVAAALSSHRLTANTHLPPHGCCAGNNVLFDRQSLKKFRGQNHRCVGIVVQPQLQFG